MCAAVASAYLQGWVIQELDRHCQPLWQHIWPQNPCLNEPIDPFLNPREEGDVTAVHVDVEAE